MISKLSAEQHYFASKAQFTDLVVQFVFWGVSSSCPLTVIIPSKIIAKFFLFTSFYSSHTIVDSYKFCPLIFLAELCKLIVCCAYFSAEGPSNIIIFSCTQRSQGINYKYPGNLHRLLSVFAVRLKVVFLNKIKYFLCMR